MEGYGPGGGVAGYGHVETLCCRSRTRIVNCDPVVQKNGGFDDLRFEAFTANQEILRASTALFLLLPAEASLAAVRGAWLDSVKQEDGFSVYTSKLSSGRSENKEFNESEDVEEVEGGRGHLHLNESSENGSSVCAVKLIPGHLENEEFNESEDVKDIEEEEVIWHLNEHDGRDRVVIDLDSGSFARWSEAVVCSIGGSERVDNWEEVSKIVGQLLPEEAEITLYPFEARRAIFHSKKLFQLHTLCTDRTYSLGKENFVGFHRWWPASNALSFTSLSKPRWIALKGILLHLWVPSILKSFGSICGGLEEVHPSTTTMSDLSFAKIRVKGGLYNTPRVIPLIFHSITYPVEVSDWEEECCENCRRWPDSMEIRYHRSWVEVAAQTVENEKTRGCVGVGGSNQNENEISNSNLESKGSLLPRLRDARSPSPRRSEQKAFSQRSQAEGTALSGSISRSKPRSESLLCQLRGKEARGDQTFEIARDLLRKITKGRKSRKNQKRNFRRRKQQMRWRESVPSVLQKHNVEDDGVCVELQGSGEGVPTVRKLPRYAEGISMAEPEFSLVSALEDGVLTSSSAAFNNKESHRSETEKRDFQRSGSQVRLCSVEIQVAGVEAEEGGFGGKSSLDNTFLHMSECVGFHQGSSRPEVGSPLPPLQGRLWVEDEEGPEEAQSHRAGSVVGQLTSSTTMLMDGGQASEQGAPSFDTAASWGRGAESSAKVGHGDLVETPARPQSVSLDHIH
ncbi:hypothetical protein HHK36_022186 [Tetracentron sinense]|uniref:DUF4283 domain-containing protein n=1 Tax=Tetracentron sinense TaxID=13715 RepID=A0A835D5V6_TETSI|nr:hypothetical protein HHK36_022186 [Tetracentron sinense]